MTNVLRNVNRLRFASLRSYCIFSSYPPCTNYLNMINKPRAVTPPPPLNSTPIRSNSTNKTPSENTKSEVTLKQKLKKAVAEYGSTVIVFHVSISLVSLGVCYLLVSSGLDVQSMMLSIGINGETSTKIATNAGTFAVAYGVHKIFAPVRMMITLTATPLIVRYLRQIGFLKKSLK